MESTPLSPFTSFTTPAPPSTPITKHTGQTAGSASPSVIIPPSPMMKKLGYGTGVSVYLLQRSPKHGNYMSPWALKKVNKTYFNKSVANNRVKQEGDILKQLSHPNLIGFRGVKHLSDGNVALLMETGGKSLMDLIDERRDSSDPAPFEASAILQLAYAIAKGLCYMHSKGVLHGDIKSGNILVKNLDWKSAKLCDLGTAIELDENMSPKYPDDQYIGTEAWSPKEILDDNMISDKADIYTFGMVLYEMLTLSVPHMADLTEDDFDSFSNEEWLEKLGTRPDLPQDIVDNPDYRHVIDLFLICSDEDFSLRPSAEDLVKIVEVMIEETSSDSK